MVEFVVRIVFGLVATVVLMPIVLFFATPYVLLAPVIHGVREREYWAAVGKGYRQLVKCIFCWGPSMLDL
jgi:hypothetical protein